MIKFIAAELCEQAKKAFLISLTTLSLGCHSWPEHEVRLSRSCLDYVCYYAIKFITAELCEQVYMMSWPWSAEPQYFRENHSANSRKTTVQIF